MLSGTIEQVYVDAVVTGTSAVGGLAGGVGAMGPTTISKVSVAGSATAGSGSTAGGLLGMTEPANQVLAIQDSQSSMSVTGSDEVGGLIGRYVEYGPERPVVVIDGMSSS